MNDTLKTQEETLSQPASGEMSPQEQAIADAAIRVIVNQGFDVVSVRKVATEAEVAPGTVQYFMGTKEQLLEKALARSAARQHERVLALRNKPNLQPRERLSRSLLELLPVRNIQREDAALWVILGAASSTRAGLAALYHEELERFRRRLIESIFPEPEWESPHASQTARLITALVNGLTLDYLHAPPNQELAAAIADDLEAGLEHILSPRR